MIFISVFSERMCIIADNSTLTTQIKSIHVHLSFSVRILISIPFVNHSFVSCDCMKCVIFSLFSLAIIEINGLFSNVLVLCEKCVISHKFIFLGLLFMLIPKNILFGIFCFILILSLFNMFPQCIMCGVLTIKLFFEID